MIAAAQTILGNLLRLLEFEDARLETATADGQVYFQIVTADAARLIGRTSQTLDAIQFLLNRLLSRQYEESPYCVVDAEHYRECLPEQLRDLLRLPALDLVPVQHPHHLAVLEQGGATVTGFFGVVGLPFLSYAAVLGDSVPVKTLIEYHGE